MALDRAAVLAYLEHHTQTQAAQHFGVSERYIRKLKAEGLASGSPLPPVFPVPPAVVQEVFPRRSYVSIADGLVASGATLWRAADGELRRVPAGMTGREWNALQVEHSAVALPPTVDEVPPAVPVPAVVPDFERESSGSCSAAAAAPLPVALHKLPSAPLPRVNRSTLVSALPSLLGSLLAASVGPLPLPAVLAFVLLLALIGRL